MRPALAGAIALIVLIVGTVFGVASLLLLPVVGAVALIALLIWFAQRRARDEPPIR
jgi:hypothetical protein